MKGALYNVTTAICRHRSYENCGSFEEYKYQGVPVIWAINKILRKDGFVKMVDDGDNLWTLFWECVP